MKSSTRTPSIPMKQNSFTAPVTPRPWSGPFARLVATALATLAVVEHAPAAASRWTAGMQTGKLELKSAGPLTFGPDGILFIADTKAAAIVAIDTGDTKAPSSTSSKPFRIEGIDQKAAALLGTTAPEILISDMAVNPLSKAVYIAISRGRGPDATPVLLRAKPDTTLEEVPIAAIKYARAQLPDAPADGNVGQGNRQSNPRLESITDIAFLQDRVLVAGLSNEEFASTLRSIPFPFAVVGKGTSVEIYHGAHGKFETRSPVRTFVPFNIGNQPHLLAAYTCTPLVQFPITDLQPGSKVKGKTIAELGNRNRPIDMIVYQKNGKDYLLLANNSRGIMKIATDKIEATEQIETPVPDGAKKGLAYETIEGWTGVDQLDRLDATHAVVVRRANAGALNLEALPLP